VVGAEGVRVYAFPAAPLAWEAGLAWDPARDAARFARLPADWDLARLRTARLGFLGAGHVGAAALAQLAPLPWAGFVFVDRDRLALHNRPSLAIAAEAAP
jgi:tRNA A37 threonylcarbamoyladenosine dehydratase